jgi:hypothetical protein
VKGRGSKKLGFGIIIIIIIILITYVELKFKYNLGYFHMYIPHHHCDTVRCTVGKTEGKSRFAYFTGVNDYLLLLK